MVHKSKVLYGIAAYIDNEIVAKMAGSWKAWVIGGAAGIAVSRADAILTLLADNPVIKSMGLMDGENIDVETVFAELRKQSQKAPATVVVPLIGPITFGPTDVDNLYRHIMEVGK